HRTRRRTVAHLPAVDLAGAPRRAVAGAPAPPAGHRAPRPAGPGRAPGDRRGRPDRPAQRQHRPVPCRRGDRRGSRRPG
ncbi:hypothetical protein BST14_29180, partial [Mycobacterium arosiense ATCC BAA-1401 = DSM 45069]